MDWEGAPFPFKVLCELFPQIDVRLIKATVLDGDDIDSAVDFLVNEGLISDGKRSDQVDELTCASQELSTIYTHESTQNPPSIENISAEAEDLTVVNGDKHEESIVWLGGLGTHRQFDSVNDLSSKGNWSRENVAEVSSYLSQKQEPQIANGLADEVISFRRNSGLESGQSAPCADKIYGCESQDSTTFSEKSAFFSPANPSLHPFDFFPTSEQGLGLPSTGANPSLHLFDFFPTSEQGLGVPSTGSGQQVLHPPLIENFQVPVLGLSTGFEQQQSDTGLMENFDVRVLALSIPEDMSKRENSGQFCTSSTVLVEGSEKPEEAYVPLHSKEIAWQSSSIHRNVPHEYLQGGAVLGMNGEPVDHLSNQASPRSFYDHWPGSDVACDDGVTWGTMSSSSRHNVNMETLNEIVQEAKCDKEYLMSAIEEMHLLRLKTEKEEAAAQRVKADAANGGLDILVKVEEMRQSIARARADNEMRAGEIYGEKAILSTEARELHSRLADTKAEQAKALTVINEIRSALQARLDLAIQDREAAEEEKKNKEVSAQKVLAMEEAFAAKAAQDSRDLEAEAEACTRLREFLIDRGSIVDSLQGEMAVLCEDVETFKKQIEEGVLLSCSRYSSMSRMSSHGSPEFMYSPIRSKNFSAISSQELPIMVSSQAQGITGGSHFVLPSEVKVGSSGSSSCISLKSVVSRVSSFYGSDGSGSVHSALGFEYSIGGTVEAPVGVAKDPESGLVDSALCTDYFSPNNSVVETGSLMAVSHELDEKDLKFTEVPNIRSENDLDDLNGLSDDKKDLKFTKVASNSSENDLDGWHVQVDDEGWHMLGVHGSKKKGSSTRSSSFSSIGAQLMEKVVWETT